MSGGGGSTTSGVTRVEPPSFAEPGLRQSVGAAQQLFGQGGPQQFQGRTVAPFSPQTEQALSQTEQLANTQDPTLQAGNQQLQQTLRGDFLNPDSNPFLQQSFNRAADLTRGRLASEFARGGRNIQASAPARSEELQTLSSNLFGQNFQNERNRQIGALGQALPFSRERFFAPQQLANVGGQVEDQAGRIIADRQNRFNFEQQRPEANLNQFIGRLTGSAGNFNTQTSSQTQPGGSRVAGALGGASAGAGLGALLASPGATGLAAIGGWPFLLGGAALGGLLG